MQQTKPLRFLRALLGQRFINWLRTKLMYTKDARELNRVLFSNVTQLNKSEIEKNIKEMRRLSEARGYDKNDQDLWDTHVYRMMLSEIWIGEIVKSLTEQAKVMDLGVESVTSDYWRLKFPGVAWSNTNWDLRYPWKTEAGTTDLIVCTELVEHLSDQANEIFNEGFYKSGFFVLLRESYQALKPGGYLFLTTPNAASVLHIKLTLQGDPPWFFIKHVREYTMNEVVEQVKGAGFEIVRNKDIHCMSIGTHPDFTSIFQILLENGYDTNGRGDDLYILARKPA